MNLYSCFDFCNGFFGEFHGNFKISEDHKKNPRFSDDHTTLMFDKILFRSIASPYKGKKRGGCMENSFSGKKELEMLSFDWSLQKPGLALTFSTFCCASGTCDNYLGSLEIEGRDMRYIPTGFDKKSALEIKNAFGSLRK